MAEPDKRDDSLEMEKRVAAQAERKRKARAEGDRGVWFGLGMFGLVGWSVAIPALIGTALGWWMDKAVADQYSWTLMGLGLGVAVGCFNAWYWVKRESERD
jgi:ATP synthase protein I